MLRRLCIFVLLLLPIVAFSQEGGVMEQRKELDKIKKEVESGRARLDSLQQAREDLAKQIADQQARISSNKKVIGRLNNQLSDLQQSVADAEKALDLGQIQLDRTRRRYLGNIRQLYLSSRSNPTLAVDRPNRELELNRQVVYLAALAEYESGRVTAASQLLDSTVSHLEDLTGESQEVASLKRKKESATQLAQSQRQKTEKTLEQVRRKETEEADRVLTLEQAAREMEIIIARLEEEAARRKQTEADRGFPTTEGIFESLKGQLLPPLDGEVVLTFGPATDPITNLRSFSPGISVQGRSVDRVVAVAGGTVVYVGTLRGYGNFVIINHDGDYYTTYGGLSRMVVSRGEFVLAGAKLGLAGEDGTIKFELRKGREPLDPIEWITIDAY